MTLYPEAIDDDRSIIRIDDNLSQIGGQAINQLRDAVFAMQRELGIRPSGSAGSLADRLDVSLNADGTIKASALTSVGLATLPIIDSQVGSNAGIKESKLDLNHSTTDLFTQLSANTVLLNSLSAFTTIINSNLLIHISGGQLLSDGTTQARHVASHIDLNAVPNDSRDISFTWTGLLAKDGYARSAETVAEALLQINDALITHENATTGAHPATAVTLDVSNFTELSTEATTVQKAIDELDDADRLQIGIHRAIMHSNGVPRTARSQLIPGPDGYSTNVVPATLARAYLLVPPNTSPFDNNNRGDDIVKFFPTNTGFNFDAQFSRVRPGDVLRINYGNGIEARYLVDSTRFQPGTEWVVRLNGVNISNADGYISDGYDAYARIDRPLFDNNIFGVFSVAAANNDIDSSIMGSVTIGNPRAASAMGIGFDPGKLDSSHYLLYLQLYPTGNPSDSVITLPGIDVTGNAGATPGKYTLESVVQATNNSLRKAGFNYRFVAFNHQGNFGIMMTDSIDLASFSIVTGSVSGSSVVAGSFTNNVIGDVVDGLDALGLGSNGSGLATPAFSSTFSGFQQASNFSTLVLPPLRDRNAVVNGVRRDTFDEGYKTIGDGYWLGSINARDVIGSSTIETEYVVEMDLSGAGLAPGKTITIQPVVSRTDSAYLINDYGRFIIKSVTVQEACPGESVKTFIRVINGIHSTGNPTDGSSGAGLEVRLYFGYDTVGFNNAHVVDALDDGTDYIRYHEIFLDGDGKTFSHERARMPKQAETADRVGTLTNWSIRDVSPKLRGFTDDGSTDFRRYVRLYILNYDSVSGEFDGYIGKRDETLSTITEFGEVTKGRKNLPVRFYDSSNVDFIEVVFNELSNGATPVLTSASPRYVDIEVFPTLRLDDEVFLLGSCKLDGNTVSLVRDRREFGTVSEKDFSTSAIDFITAGERLLHANGIIQGFDYEGESIDDEATLNFNGGIALVNGKFLALDDASVRIPEIRPTGSSLGVTVDWVICVNDTGSLVAKVLTDVKDQFFATTGSGDDFYVESLTFQELVSVRNDLTPIATVNVTIASVTINTVLDVRKFILNETGNIPLSIVADGYEHLGNFISFEAAQHWVNSLKTHNNVIKIRGTINITSASINLSGFEVPVTFEGENGVINITNNSGLLVGSNMTFRKLTFNLNPTSVSYDVDEDRVNFIAGGCLFRTVQSNEELTNLRIEDCKFNSSLTGRRPPFISLLILAGNGASGTASKIRIIDNEFDDADSDSGTNAAIAIIGVNNSGSNTDSPVLRDCYIDRNVCNQKQSVVVASGSANRAVKESVGYARALVCSNVQITSNRCGAILLRFKSNVGVATDYPFGVIVEKNWMIYMTNFAEANGLRANFGSGLRTVHTDDTIDTLSSQLHVSNNFMVAARLGTFTDDSASDDGYGSLMVHGNHIAAEALSDLAHWSENDGIDEDVVALYLASQDTTSNTFVVGAPKIQAISNKINFGADGSGYRIGIYLRNQGVIANNQVSGLENNSATIGIDVSDSLFDGVIVTGNYIYKRSIYTIAAFIDVSSQNANITGNTIQPSYVDSANTNFVDAIRLHATTPRALVNNNRNHIVNVGLPVSGTFFTNGADPGVIAELNSLPSGWIGANKNVAVVRLTADVGSVSALKMFMPFDVPVGASIENFNIRYSFNSGGGEFSAGTIDFNLHRTVVGSSSTLGSSTVFDTETLDLTTLSLPTTDQGSLIISPNLSDVGRAMINTLFVLELSFQPSTVITASIIMNFSFDIEIVF